MGLRGLKITMASITLSRPSRKGNLANVVAPILDKIEPTVAQKRRERKMRVSTEEQTPGHVLCETRTRLCSPDYMVDLAATKSTRLQRHATTFV
jgi:hypothetical protein